MASRMESTGIPSQIQISASTHEELQAFGFRFEKQVPKAVKGKGEQMTYLLKPRERRNSFGEYEEAMKSKRQSYIREGDAVYR